MAIAIAPPVRPTVRDDRGASRFAPRGSSKHCAVGPYNNLCRFGCVLFYPPVTPSNFSNHYFIPRSLSATMIRTSVLSRALDYPALYWSRPGVISIVQRSGRSLSVSFLGHPVQCSAEFHKLNKFWLMNSDTIF